MSSPWIVHQYALSPNAERLRRVLVRLGLPFAVRDYLPFDEAGRAQVRGLVEQSGHNQMPVLERDGSFYGDSLAVTAMLVAEYPDRAGRLYPADPARAAAVHAFVLAGDSGFLRPESKFLTKEFRQQKGEEHAQKIVRFGYERREGALRAWDAAVAGQPFLAGGEYSMADIGVAPYVNARINIGKLVLQLAAQGVQSPFDPELWPEWDLDGAAYPNLRAWLDRCNTPEFTESP